MLSIHRFSGTVLLCLSFLLIGWLGSTALAAAPEAPEVQPVVAGVAAATHAPAEASSHAAMPIPLAWSIPFAILLAAIALMPFIHKHWWEHNYPYVAVALALIPPIYYFFIGHEPMRWVESMIEYISFIVLLGSLFIISGGIHINISRKATPLANVVLLLLGAIIANIFGTTGASMLLIRPFLRINKNHIKPYHVIFFIFVVSNVGGSLTPIGDPPLFLGYLRGVPFFWVLEHCFAPWTVAVGLLLAIFFVWDTLEHRRIPRTHKHDGGPRVELTGMQNFLFIALVLYAVFRPGAAEVIHHMVSHGITGHELWTLITSREILMLAAAGGSILTTAKALYQKNEFTYAPIREVAILFIGIFSTMAPTLQWLESNAERLPIKTPGQFYFATGALSSVLDNAPTYLTFLKARLGELEHDQVKQVNDDLKRMCQTKQLTVDPVIINTSVGIAEAEIIRNYPDRVLAGNVTPDQLGLGFILGIPALNNYLVAISLGAVFFGACTYIGNGPNFMVKSIADSSGIQTPSFLGYIIFYTLPVLIPVYVLVWAIFFVWLA